MIPPDDATPAPDDLSSDPEEQLRYENELLKIKLQAELGAVFGTSDDIPPEIERQFLEQVLLFEKMKGDTPAVRLGDYLGHQTWPVSDTLSAQELEKEWASVAALLAEKRIHVDFLADYPLSVKYDFVTTELVNEEFYPPVLEGQAVGFIYEEHHPNHAYDLEQLAERLLRDFFNNEITPETDYLGQPLVTPGGPLDRAALSDRIALFHDLFAGIPDWAAQHVETAYEIGEDAPAQDEKARPAGMAYVEGDVHYTVERDDGGSQEIVGPFKVYFGLEDGWWTVFYFELEGFSQK